MAAVGHPSRLYADAMPEIEKRGHEKSTIGKTVKSRIAAGFADDAKPS
jgi:hypothetical protein